MHVQSQYCNINVQVMEVACLNEELREVFTVLTPKLVETINADSVVDSLFSAKVLSAADYDFLSDILERKRKTRKLLALLHKVDSPGAFVKLYEAIKTEGAYDWLTQEIDDLRRLRQASKRIASNGATLKQTVYPRTLVSKDVASSGAKPKHTVDPTLTSKRLTSKDAEPKQTDRLRASKDISSRARQQHENGT